MIKFLKIIASLIILICLFLPLSQCSKETMQKVDSVTGEIIKSSETVYNDLVISDSLLGEEAEITVESLILPIIFLIPLLLTLLPNFSNWKRNVKYTIQLLFSTWFCYQSYLLVNIGTPLISGWVLIVASVFFVILCAIECIPMKHNKSNQSDAQKTRTSV